MIKLAGGLGSLAVAVALFTRYGISGELTRDEAIYTYGGQQLAHGVAPYTSIFDPKGPIAVMLAGLAAYVARVVGSNDISAIRLAFFGCACLAVVAVYLLAARLWHSALAGVVAAVVFVSFNGFASDALSGPDAKTPSVLFSVLSMWLLLRRKWFLAGVAASLALLDWQPLFGYAVVVIGGAALMSKAVERRRAVGLAVAGVALPIVVVTAYFAAAGALDTFFQATVAFPLTGADHSKGSLVRRLRHIAAIVHQYYRFSGLVFWLGLAALLLIVVGYLVRNRHRLRWAVRNPLVCVILTTLLIQSVFALFDFISYPDLYPLLVYPALGLGGVVAITMRRLGDPVGRRAASAGVLAAVTVLAALSAVWFTHSRSHQLEAQRNQACAIERILGTHGGLYALGDPTSLVMTDRRNPDNFIYLNQGVDRWKVDHTPGGFDGWTAQIAAAHPRLVVMQTWHGPLHYRMKAWLLSKGFHAGYLGRWHVLMTPATQLQAAHQGIVLTAVPTQVPLGPSGRLLPNECR